MKFFLIKSWSITRQITFSFALVILIGSVLLSLPISQYQNNYHTTYLDNLFNVISMVCVTGLSIAPISEIYNGIGQTISIILMQIGGLGLITLIAFGVFALQKKMNFAGHTLLQSALNRKDSKNLKEYLFFAYKTTIIIESLFGIIIMTDFIPRFGIKHGIFNSIFLTVSAFCNAGFDNFGSSSLNAFVLNPTINFSVSALIIFGGIGFAVWDDVIANLKRLFFSKPVGHGVFYKKLSNQTRLILQTTVIILFLGTLLTWYLEKDNPKTISNYTFPQQIMVSFFQTVTMRTAGFSTVSFKDTFAPTNFIYMFQMIIGGGPGGTAGGIKVTTFAIAFLLIKSELVGQSLVTFSHRVIASKTVKQTISVLLFFITILVIGYTLLLSFEPNLDPFSLLFETISAMNTVGVTMDLTSKLSTQGRIIIMLLMFIGRVGPITFLFSLIQKKKKNINYAETDILVG